MVVKMVVSDRPIAKLSEEVVRPWMVGRWLAVH
jgi:hypothetical protein